MSVHTLRGLSASLLISGLVVVGGAGWAQAPAAGGTYDQWTRHRRAMLGDPSLIRYYTFETAGEGATVPNLTGQGADLSFSVARRAGAPEETLQVIQGRWPAKKAVRLDQGFFAAEPFDVADKSFTVAAWLRKNGPGTHRGNADATNGTLLSTGIGYWDGWRLTTSYPDKWVGFEIGRPQPINAVGLRAEGMPDGVWLHLAATWDGEQMRLYLNGLLAAVREYDGEYTPPQPGATFRVGYAGYGFGSVVLDVDEVAVWERALAPEEVLQNAHFYAPLPEVARERFAEAGRCVAASDWAGAQEAYGALVDMAGLHSDYRNAARLGLAEALRRQNQGAAAAAQLGRLLQEPELLEQHRTMALGQFLVLSRFASAGAVPPSVFERVLEMQGLSGEDRFNMRLNLAACYQEAGSFAAARNQYARLAEVGAMDPAARPGIQLQIGHTYWAEGNYAAARAEYAKVVADEQVPPYYRSYAQLRIADSFVRERAWNKARGAFALVSRLVGAPRHHVTEAEERAREVERLAQGLPARDPAWSRTQLPEPPKPAVELYVSSRGDDANDGSREKPFATLEGARDAIRALKARAPLPDGGVTVYLRAGEYRRSASFELTEEDSGTESAPLVYRAYPGEAAVLTGGVPVRGLRPVTDAAALARVPEEARGKVMQADLKAQGIEDYGELQPRGFGQPAVPCLELFFNGEPMTPARWPNEGFVRTGEVVQGGGRGEPATFRYEGDRPARWTTAPDPWAYGYWYFDWADAAMGVASVHPEKGLITLAHAVGYGVRQGQRYYVFNLLEELDAPGEWYLDREKGMLYFYPPGPVEQADVQLSMLETPMIQMQDVSHVTLLGLVCEFGRGDAIVIRGGTGDLVAGCTVRQFGGTGVTLDGGTRHGVLGCDIYRMGRNGTWVRGGDRKTLTPGGHFIENCHIYDFSRVDRTYTPAVWMDGVGNRIAHNLMHLSPHHAMRIEGNDHLIEFNEVHSVVWESDDQGGLDMFFNPTYRGNVLRYNFWHHIGSGLDTAGQAGIRLDDAISGTAVYGNVFYRCSGGHFGGLQIHGGKENLVDNNVFVDCKYAVSFSGWGERRWQEFLASENVRRAISETVDISSPPYSTRYPELARLAEDPDINFLWRNLVCDCGEFMTRDRGIQVTMENYVTAKDPGFVSVEKRDFRLRDDSPVYDRIGFRPIPFEEIGLYQDQYRASWPVEHSITEHYVGE